MKIYLQSFHYTPLPPQQQPTQPPSSLPPKTHNAKKKTQVPAPPRYCCNYRSIPALLPLHSPTQSPPFFRFASSADPSKHTLCLTHTHTLASASLQRRNPANTLPASRLLRAASATTAPRPMLPVRSCRLSFSTAAVAVASRQRWKAVTSTSLERRADRRATCRSAACRVKSCGVCRSKVAGRRGKGEGRRNKKGVGGGRLYHTTRLGYMI